MSLNAANTSTRIQPVGSYTSTRIAPSTQVQQPPTGGIYIPVPEVHVPDGVKSFFGDVWDGGVGQLKTNGKRVLHPIETAKTAISYLDKTPKKMVKDFFAPYSAAIKAGRPGLAIGRLLGNAASIAGAVLGGRYLLGRGGASVGTGGPLSGLFEGFNNIFGGAFRAVGNVVSSVGRGLRSMVSWLIPGGSSVGFR